VKKFLYGFLDSEAQQSIKATHQIQKNLHGVYEPPSLKQLVSLRHLLIRTGSMNEVKSEELLGLSKVECRMVLKKLNLIYVSQRRSQSRNSTWNEVERLETTGH